MSYKAADTGEKVAPSMPCKNRVDNAGVEVSDVLELEVHALASAHCESTRRSAYTWT